MSKVVFLHHLVEVNVSSNLLLMAWSSMCIYTLKATMLEMQVVCCMEGTLTMHCTLDCSHVPHQYRITYASTPQERYLI